MFTENLDPVRARAALTEKIKKGQEKYRTNFSDDSDRWEQLAVESGFLLPKWWVAPSTKLMRRWLRRVGIKERDYCAACGEGWKLEDFAILNPDWPLRAWVGLLLEYADELDNAKAVNDRHTHKISSFSAAAD